MTQRWWCSLGDSRGDVVVAENGQHAIIAIIAIIAAIIAIVIIIIIITSDKDKAP
ncbi:hypothetical protein E4U43_001621, partial [Claviceps pusilla]